MLSIASSAAAAPAAAGAAVDSLAYYESDPSQGDPYLRPCSHSV